MKADFKLNLVEERKKLHVPEPIIFCGVAGGGAWRIYNNERTNVQEPEPRTAFPCPQAVKNTYNRSFILQLLVPGQNCKNEHIKLERPLIRPTQRRLYIWSCSPPLAQLIDTVG